MVRLRQFDGDSHRFFGGIFEHDGGEFSPSQGRHRNAICRLRKCGYVIRSYIFLFYVCMSCQE